MARGLSVGWRIAVTAVVSVAPASAFAQLPDAPLTRYAGNPLLTKGPAGSYDQVKIGPRAMMREAPGVWKMWYEAVPAGNQSTTAYATSPDGHAWTKYAGNPVMIPSVAWEGAGGMNHEDSPTAILKEHGIYKLWYHGISGSTRAIGYAESADGLNWTKYAGNPVLTPGQTGDWDADSICEPVVVKVGAQYDMFYSRCTGSGGIGLATSSDGKSWTKYVGNPVLSVSADPNAWDSQQIDWGGVYYDGQRFFMWYPGKKSTDTGGFSVGLAASTDGMNWTRSPNNPVMTPPAMPLGKGDDLGLENSPRILRIGDAMQIYYGGFRFCCPEDATLCLATTPATGVANAAPVVDAGADQTIPFGTAAMLHGTVMDDDTPVPLASVQTSWTKTAGPGSVAFANAQNLDTTAMFSAPGDYTLTLTASDTALTSSASLQIVVVSNAATDGGTIADAAAAVDASNPDGSGSPGSSEGAPSQSSSSCACKAVGASEPPPLAWLVTGMAALGIGRRRSRTCRRGRESSTLGS